MEEINRLRQQDLFWRDIDGSVVVLDGRSWEYLNLNATGRLLWGALKDGASESELAQMLAAMYGIVESTALKDVKSFLRVLIDRDLLEAAPRA